MTNKTGPRLGERLIERGELSKDALELALERQRALRQQRLGDLLVERKLLSRHHLQMALDEQAAEPGEPLGEVLVRMGYLADGDLEIVLGEQEQNRRKPIGEILVELGMINSATLRAALMAFGVLAAGCSTTGGNSGNSQEDLVKAYEPTSVLVQWKKASPEACGDVKHAYGCAKITHKGSMCIIELPENAPDWAIAHEFKHCFGYRHKHG